LAAGIIARHLLPGPNNPLVLTTAARDRWGLRERLGWYRLDQGAGFLGATVGAVVVLFLWHCLVVPPSVSDPTTHDPLGPHRWF
jgi:uncharacterized membrane protein YeaQ/YmgE (transglycosylase-associated protein family)